MKIYNRKDNFMKNIILYSNGCPKCKVLKRKLESKKIEFEETDDFSKLQDMGIQSLPIMEVDGIILSFVEANNWINNQ